MKRLTRFFAAALIVSVFSLAPLAESEAWFNMNGPWNNGSGWGGNPWNGGSVVAHGIVVPAGEATRGMVATAAACHGIMAGAAVITGAATPGTAATVAACNGTVATVAACHGTVATAGGAIAIMAASLTTAITHPTMVDILTMAAT